MPRRGRGVTLESKELLRFKPTALQKEAPFGGILFLLVKKEYGERHAKEPMVLWKLLVPKRGPRRSPAVRWVRWGKEEQRSERAFRPWAKTRDTQLATTLGYRLRLDESVPDVFALVPSPNSNQRRCSRASSHLQYRRKVPVNPVETQVRESVLFHWFSAASCLLRPGGGAQQHRRKSSWGALLRWKIEDAVGKPLRVGIGRPTSPYRGGCVRTAISSP